MKEKIVALGITSSISIYKACEILRGFQKKGCRVRIVMTRNAARLVSPLLFSALSGEDAIVDLFDARVSRRVEHVALAREISLLCVAPATANVIAKFASGVADDFLSTLYLATRRPVLVAPAMNEAMYHHPRTWENLRKLRGAGVEFVEPEKRISCLSRRGLGEAGVPGADRRGGSEDPGPDGELEGDTNASSRRGRPGSTSIPSVSSRMHPPAKWATRSPGKPPPGEPT